MNRCLYHQTDVLVPQELDDTDIEYLSELRRLLEKEIIAIIADAPRFGSVGFTATFHAGRAVRLDRIRSVTTTKAGTE